MSAIISTLNLLKRIKYVSNKKAPDFTATAVLADGSIVEDFNYIIILEKKEQFYSLAF